MENAYMKQKGTYSIEDDQLTVTLETWSEPSTYTFSVVAAALHGGKFRLRHQRNLYKKMII